MANCSSSRGFHRDVCTVTYRGNLMDLSLDLILDLALDLILDLALDLDPSYNSASTKQPIHQILELIPDQQGYRNGALNKKGQHPHHN